MGRTAGRLGRLVRSLWKPTGIWTHLRIIRRMGRAGRRNWRLVRTTGLLHEAVYRRTVPRRWAVASPVQSIRRDWAWNPHLRCRLAGSNCGLKPERRGDGGLEARP